MIIFLLPKIWSKSARQKDKTLGRGLEYLIVEKLLFNYSIS